jgi:dUTP pyrophosphatase
MLFDIVNNRRSTDSGFDIPMLFENAINGVHEFNLQIKIAATHNNAPIPALLLPRSSISNTPFRLTNSIGLIDAGYRGTIRARVDVLESPLVMVPNRTRLFQICQGNFMPWDNIVIAQFEHELPAPPDNRGDGGFGSTN